MKIIENYEMYAQTVNGYKREKKRCRTNMIFMQNEINKLIDGGKLYYDLIEGILWFFVKNEDYYTAFFCLPKEEKIKLTPQDLDVIVELYSNNDRYHSEWETELMEIGFEKYHKSFEFVTKKEEYGEQIEKQAKKARQFVEKLGCHYRSAKQEDCDALYRLWRSKIDKYAIPTMTNNQINEMVRHNRSIIVLNEKNEIVAAGHYSRTGNTAVRLSNVSLQKGFGPFVNFQLTASAFREGCDRVNSWVWDGNKNTIFGVNKDSSTLQKRPYVLTGRICQQFLMRKTGGTHENN